MRAHARQRSRAVPRTSEALGPRRHHLGPTYRATRQLQGDVHTRLDRVQLELWRRSGEIA